MIFSSVMFLYLLPLAALPVLFHFILKQRRRKLIFSSLLFFNRINPRLNSHRQIKQWLLLLLRVLVIAFVLLALSRPVLRMGSSDNSKAALVIVIDNSASMIGLAGGKAVEKGNNIGADKSAGSNGANMNNKLTVAKKAAEAVIAGQSPSSPVGLVLLVQDGAVKKTGEMLSNHKDVLQQIQQVRPTNASGDAMGTLVHACDMLHKLPAGGGVIHVFTDLQENEWDKSVGKISAGTLKNIVVYFHRIKSHFRNKANIAVTGVQLPVQKILPHHPYNVGVVLRNDSAYGGQFNFSFVTSTNGKGNQQIKLAAFATKTVSIPVEPDGPGTFWVKASVSGDSFAADNEANIALMCGNNGVALFAGARSDFAVLPVAFSPTGKGLFTGLVTHFCELSKLQGAVKQEKPLILVMTWDGLQKLNTQKIITERVKVARSTTKNVNGMEDAVEWLREYVERGGDLLLVPDVGKVCTGIGLPDWLGAGIKERKLLAKPMRLMLLDKNNEFWQGINVSNAEAIVERCAVRAYYQLQLGLATGSGSYIPLLGVDFNNVILAWKRQNRGRVYVCGSAFSPLWNTLVSTGLMVVMVQRMVVGDDSGSVTNGNIVLRAGDMLHLPSGWDKGRINTYGNTGVAGKSVSTDGKGDGNVSVVSLIGDSMQWQGGRNSLPLFVRSGAYIVKGAGRQQCISVLPAIGEADERYIDVDKIPFMQPGRYFVSDYNPEAQPPAKQFRPVATFSLYLPLLILAMLALILEAMLANSKTQNRVELRVG